MMNGLMLRYTSERNQLCVCVRVHVIITSALHLHQSDSPVVEVSTNRELMTLPVFLSILGSVGRSSHFERCLI